MITMQRGLLSDMIWAVKSILWQAAWPSYRPDGSCCRLPVLAGRRAVLHSPWRSVRPHGLHAGRLGRALAS